MMRFEIRNPDGFHHALLLQMDQSFPGRHVKVLFGGWPVNEIKINITQVKTVKRLVKSPQGVVIALSVLPHLRGDENIRTINSAISHSPVHSTLVDIQRCRVNMTITHLKSLRISVISPVV